MFHQKPIKSFKLDETKQQEMNGINAKINQVQLFLFDKTKLRFNIGLFLL
jgi:hypothetical protein